MSDNTIRAIIVLLCPVLFVCIVALGLWHALATAYDELVMSWRAPQTTAIARWDFWRRS